MKATELRVGNLVRPVFNGTNPSQEPIIVTGMFIRQCHRIEIDGSENIGHEGIPLTEEWLFRFGFLKHEGNAFENLNLPYWAKDGVLLFFNIGQEEYAWKLGYGEMRSGIHYVATMRWVDKVNELQNAFHALTGKELELKQSTI